MKIIQNRIPMEHVRYTASNTYILSFQVEGMCVALWCLIEHRMDAGPGTRAILKGVRDNFVSDSSGDAIKYFPEVTDDMSTADLLAIAEVLRTSLLAFLTPEERESRGRFGFE